MENYIDHEYGIEDTNGYLMENKEQYIEEMNDLLKDLHEARKQASKWRQRCLMCTPWSDYENDKKLPWEKNL